MTQRNEVPIRSEVYGQTADGQEVRRFILRNGNLELSVIEYGAIIDGLVLASKGQAYSLVDGLQSFEAYESDRTCRGALVGPVVDHASASFQQKQLHQVDSTQDVQTMINDGEGLHLMLWEGRESVDHRGPCVELETVHLDGMGGEEGNLYVRVRFVLAHNGVCHIEYEVLSDEARAINLAHHLHLRIPGMSSTPSLVLHATEHQKGPEFTSFGAPPHCPTSPMTSKSIQLCLDDPIEPSLVFFEYGDQPMMALAQLNNGPINVAVHSDQRALYVWTSGCDDSQETSNVCLVPHVTESVSTRSSNCTYIVEPGHVYRQETQIRVQVI